MRRHAKAPSVGSTASSVGRGSIAPTPVRTRGALIVAALSALLLGLVLAATAAFAAPPTVTIDPAPTASYTTAHVTGHINPGDSDTYYFFAYKYRNEFEPNTGSPVQGPVVANSGETAVSADLTGLQPGREYEVSLEAYNADDEHSATEYVYFTTEAVAPPSVSIDAPSSITPTSAHLSGQIDPQAPAGNPAVFDVNWHFVCIPECPGLSGGTVAADNASHEVSVDASALKLNTAYEVRLVAENAGGTVTVGPESFTTPALAPQLASISAIALSTEAELKATINPGALTTTYHFEYGPTSSYGQSTATSTLPAGESPVPISTHIFGLTPISGYHFRLIASNSLGTVEGPDQTFTTIPTGAEPEGCTNTAIRTQQGARRLADCRAYERVSPAENAGVPVSKGNLFGIRASDDGDKVVYAPEKGSYPGAEATPLVPRALATRTDDGWFTHSLDKPTSQPTGHLGGNPLTGTILAVSKDTTRMVVVSSLSLGGQGVDGNGNIYIYDTTTDDYTLVTSSSDPGFFRTIVAPNIEGNWIGGSADFRTIAFQAFFHQLYVWSESTGLRSLGAGFPGYMGSDGFTIRPDAVSEDGSRFYYAAGIPDGPVVLDENGTETVISISRRVGDPPDPVPGVVLSASPDGRYLLFQAESPLTEDAAPGLGFYRYDADSDELEYLDGLPGPYSFDFGDGVLKAWPERGEAYYQYREALYHLADGEIALVPTPGFSTEFGNRLGFSASPDGRYAAYEYDGKVFLYDEETGAVSCASCRSDGAATTKSAKFSPPFNPGLFEQYLSRAVTDDGAVFFDTPDPLVATDVNGARDVYGYRDGRAFLVSPGTQPFAADFSEVTPSGRDVFFTTGQRLVVTDTDDATDLYDARINGGIASQNLAPIPGCSGDGCRGATPAAPEGLNAATETLRGRENPRAGANKRCGKGQQRQKRKGKARCVKQHKRHAKQGKQSHNRSQGR